MQIVQMIVPNLHDPIHAGPITRMPSPRIPFDIVDQHTTAGLEHPVDLGEGGPDVEQALEGLHRYRRVEGGLTGGTSDGITQVQADDGQARTTALAGFYGILGVIDAGNATGVADGRANGRANIEHLLARLAERSRGDLRFRHGESPATSCRRIARSSLVRRKPRSVGERAVRPTTIVVLPSRLARPHLTADACQACRGEVYTGAT